MIRAGTFRGSHRVALGVPLQYQILCFAGPTLTVRSRCRPNPEGPWQADGRFRHGTEARSYHHRALGGAASLGLLAQSPRRGRREQAGAGSKASSLRGGGGHRAGRRGHRRPGAGSASGTLGPVERAAMPVSEQPLRPRARRMASLLSTTISGSPVSRRIWICSL